MHALTEFHQNELVLVYRLLKVALVQYKYPFLLFDLHGETEARNERQHDQGAHIDFTISRNGGCTRSSDQS